jgi:hypothetical protein
LSDGRAACAETVHASKTTETNQISARCISSSILCGYKTRTRAHLNIDRSKNAGRVEDVMLCSAPLFPSKPLEQHRLRRLRRPGGEPVHSPVSATARLDCRPSGIRWSAASEGPLMRHAVMAMIRITPKPAPLPSPLNFPHHKNKRPQHPGAELPKMALRRVSTPAFFPVLAPTPR